MVTRLGRSAGVIAAILLCGTAAVAQQRSNGADQAVVIQLRRLNLEEMTMARLAQAEGTDPKVRELAAHLLEEHAAADSQLVEYAARKDMNMPAVAEAPVAEASGVLAIAPLASAQRGAQFDAVFARKAVNAHQGMIAAADKGRQLATDPELQQLLANQLGTLWEHLSMSEALQGSLPEPVPTSVQPPGEPAVVSRTRTGADNPPAAAVIIIGP